MMRWDCTPLLLKLLTFLTSESFLIVSAVAMSRCWRVSHWLWFFRLYLFHRACLTLVSRLHRLEKTEDVTERLLWTGEHVRWGVYMCVCVCMWVCVCVSVKQVSMWMWWGWYSVCVHVCVRHRWKCVWGMWWSVYICVWGDQPLA